MKDRYAVMGNPVSHSKSPAIHAAFAEQTGEALTYEAILVEEGGFAEAVTGFFDNGGMGLNITVPFKQEAWELAVTLSDGARLAGAVNTLFMDKGNHLCGHNTDGPGLVRDMCRNHGGTVKGKHLLVLGAGGAARGILLPLLQEQPASVIIVNRTAQRAVDLAGLFRDHGNVSACTFDELPGQQFDWVINATSASLQGDLPPLPDDLLAPGAWCYDLMYADTATPFVSWANGHGADKAIDGLGMLIEQAAESFFLWRGVRPETASVIAGLRKQGR